MNTEIVVPGAGNAHEALLRPDQAIQALAELHRNDKIVLAVHYQHRRAMTLPARKSERNRSFINSRTGTNQ